MPKKKEKIEKKIRTHEIHLKCGLDVVVDINSQTWCKGCGRKIWWAVNPKTKKLMPICLTGFMEWDTHFADCPMADKFRKRGEFLKTKIRK